MNLQNLLGFALFGTMIVGCGGNTTPSNDLGVADLAVKSDLAGGAADLSSSPDLSPATVTVNVGQGGNVFVPATLTINAGDTVKFVWASNNHNVVSGTVAAGVGTPDNKFCNPNNQNCAAAPVANTGNMYSFTFTTKGTYPYFCRPHAGAGMTGTITVQ